MDLYVLRSQESRKVVFKNVFFLKHILALSRFESCNTTVCSGTATGALSRYAQLTLSYPPLGTVIALFLFLIPFQRRSTWSRHPPPSPTAEHMLNAPLPSSAELLFWTLLPLRRRSYPVANRPSPPKANLLLPELPFPSRSPEGKLPVGAAGCNVDRTLANGSVDTKASLSRTASNVICLTSR